MQEIQNFGMAKFIALVCYYVACFYARGYCLCMSLSWKLELKLSIFFFFYFFFLASASLLLMKWSLFKVFLPPSFLEL